MSITVVGRIEAKLGYNAQVSTYELGPRPAVNIGTEQGVSIEVYGTASGLNSLSAYLNVNTVTTRPGGTPRPSTDYDSVRTIWGGAVFPRDAINILSAMEEVGASIGDITYATGDSPTAVRQKLGLIAPPLKWRMSVSPAATIFVGPLSYSSLNDRAADSNLSNGCTINFPDKSGPVTYSVSISLYDGISGTIYASGGLDIVREATYTPGITTSGATVSDSGKTYTPSGSYKFTPSTESSTNNTGTLTNGSTITVPSPYTGISIKAALSTFAVGGSAPPYSDFRVLTITPATSQSVPTAWTSSSNFLDLVGLTTTESTYEVEIRYWDVDPRLSGAITTPASATSKVSYKFKSEISTSVAITESNTVVNKNSNLTFTINTSGYPDGTVLDWAIEGNVKTNDFTDNQLTGTFTVQSNTATISKTISSTVLVDSFFTLKVKTNSTGSTLATSSKITISPYEITADATTINEDGTVTFTVTTVNVTNGDSLYWTTQGTVNSADFVDNKLSGTVIVNSNTANIVRQLTEDVRKEGSENFKIEIRSGSLTGPVIAQSDIVVINDSSFPEPPPGYTGTEEYNSALPNGPLNPQYFEISNLGLAVTPLNKIHEEVKSIDEKFGNSNSYLSRIADSLESIAVSLKGLESHQKTIKDLAEGKGINTTSPLEWFNMITTYRLLVEEGDVLNVSEELSAAEQQKAFDEVSKYVEVISKLPTGLKK